MNQRNQREQITNTLKYVQQTMVDTFIPSKAYGGKKFTGKITFVISCTDGGVSNTCAEINRYMTDTKGSVGK